MRTDPKFQKFLEEVESREINEEGDLPEDQIIEIVQEMDPKEIVATFGNVLHGLGEQLLGKKVKDILKN